MKNKVKLFAKGDGGAKPPIRKRKKSKKNKKYYWNFYDIQILKNWYKIDEWEINF